MFAKSAVFILVLCLFFSVVTTPLFAEETATPSPTVSPTLTPAASPTLSATVSPTVSATATASTSNTPSISPTATSKPTAKATARVVVAKTTAKPTSTVTAVPTSMPVATIAPQIESTPMVQSYTTTSKNAKGPGLFLGILAFVLAGATMAGGIFILRKNPKLK